MCSCVLLSCHGKVQGPAGVGFMRFGFGLNFCRKVQWCKLFRFEGGHIHEPVDAMDEPGCGSRDSGLRCCEAICGKGLGAFYPGPPHSCFFPVEDFQDR